MAVQKKKIPLAVLEALQSITKNKSKYYYLINPGSALIKFIDSEDGSDFYFHVLSFSNDNNVLRININFKPRNVYDTDNYNSWFTAEQVKSIFDNWVSYLEGYASCEEFFTDAQLKQFEQDYFEEFKFLNEESKLTPFTLRQIFYLDEYLENIEANITEYKNVENEVEINEIQSDATELRNQLGKQTKEWVAKKFCSILAKITKEGPIVMKGVFKEATKEIISQGVKVLLEHSVKLL